MPAASSDLNLLFGMLALQLDFITKDQLLLGMQAWILDKKKPLSRLLADQGVLSADKLQLLNALVRKHLEAHGNDPNQSIAALNAQVSPREALKQIRDPDVHTSLARIKELRPAPRQEQYNTIAPAAGKAAASRFRILRTHAKGGLGVVFVARDEEIGREVALKEIQIHLARDADSRARFELEAEITGGLEHPGIVPVYGLGHYADGRPYYAMRFIRGDSLKEAADQFHAADVPGRDATERNLAIRQLLRRFTDVCNAIEYAHSKGVLHRDLKPGNIMLGRFGETLVVDWGLAKAQGKAEAHSSTNLLDEAPLSPSSVSNSSKTVMGSAIGTPAFMSPEQAAGRLDLLGAASDIYSLGATLYYILTGQPSIVARDLAEVLRCVKKGDFPRPRAVNPRIDLPLEAVCLKAMARDPADRYLSAADLKTDIERWLDDSPVSAWREPFTVKARRWINRHRTLTIATVAGVLVAALSLGIATVLLTKANDDLASANMRIEEKRKEAEAARVEADEQTTIAIEQKKIADGQKTIAVEQTRIAQVNEKKADDARGETAQQKEIVDWKVYVRTIALARAAWQANNLDDAYKFLNDCNPRFRGWEHRFLEASWKKGQIILTGNASGVAGVAFAPDGRRVVSAGKDNTLRIWDPATGREVSRIDNAHSIEITCLAMSDDGRFIVTGGADKLVKVWDANGLAAIPPLKGHTDSVLTVALSADGRRIVSGSGDRTVKVWDAKTGTETFTFTGHKGEVRGVAIHPDGERVVSSSADKTVKVWDATTGAEILSLNGHANTVWSVAFSADGERIVSGSDDKTVKVWDAKTGANLLTLRGHNDLVWSVAISKDGRRIVSGSGNRDRTVRVWDAKSGEELHVLRGHQDWITGVAINKDGTRIVSGSVDKTVRVWDTTQLDPFTALDGHADDVSSVAFSGDGQFVVTGSDDRTAKVWEAKTGRDVLTLKGHALPIASVAFSKDGQRIVTGSLDKTLRVWHAKTGMPAFALPGHTDEVTSVAFSADGQRIVSGSRDKTVKVWDAMTGASIRTLKGHIGIIYSVAISPDGRRIASGSEDKTIKIWDAATGAETATFVGHLEDVRSVAFSADGQRIASGSNDKTIKIWDAATGANSLTLKGHTDHVWSVAFGPDDIRFVRGGERIVSGGEDETVRIWETITGQETLTLRAHKNAVRGVAFSGDGQRIASGGDKTALVWEAARKQGPK